MGFRLRRTFALPALVCAGALSVALVASASAADAKATVKAVAKTPAVSSSAPRPAVGGAVGGRATSIMGAAWKADNTPIPAAKIRLRNVLTGRIEADHGRQRSRTVHVRRDRRRLVRRRARVGQRKDPGHRAPVHDRARRDRRHVRAARHARSPWFSGFFGNAASAVAAVAASTGVTAVAPEEMACASPPCSQ